MVRDRTPPEPVQLNQNVHELSPGLEDNEELMKQLGAQGGGGDTDFCFIKSPESLCLSGTPKMGV